MKRYSLFTFLVCLFLSQAVAFSQTKAGAKPPIPIFVKPLFMFDNASALINQPPMDISNMAIKLRSERGYNEEMVPLKDKKGLRRIAFFEHGNAQTNCSPYADMYFDSKNKWLSTEEFFSISTSDSTQKMSKAIAKFSLAVEAKGFRIGICEEGGNASLWRISTPALVWYECEVFKKNTENNALAMSTEKEPFRVPNPDIYGTAYFDSNGNLVKIQPKSKVKLTAN